MSAFAAPTAGAQASTGDQGFEKDVCWICLEESSQERPLVNPCKCPSRLSHSVCLATWQLHSSGKGEDKACRFCASPLPPPFEAFKAADSALASATSAPAEPKAIIAAVVYNNQVYRIPVRPGPEGRAEFKARVKALFNLSNQFDCTFDTKLPGTGDKLSLRGLDCYEAATRCAALATARSGPSASASAAHTAEAASGAAAAASAPSSA